jgi:hypothetical protein
MDAQELQEKTDAFRLTQYTELTAETDRIAREIARRIEARRAAGESSRLAERFGRVILKVKGIK